MRPVLREAMLDASGFVYPGGWYDFSETAVG
jgi:hypothetical protein